MSLGIKALPESKVLTVFKLTCSHFLSLIWYFHFHFPHHFHFPPKPAEVSAFTFLPHLRSDGGKSDEGEK